MDKQIKYYFSEHLEKCLQRISVNRNTLVEAPAGYGKTTAVRHSFEVKGRKAFWFRPEKESMSLSYKEFIGLLGHSDMETAENLMALGLPNRNNIEEICHLIYSVDADEDIYYVLYDKPFLPKQYRDKILGSLFSNRSKKLHRIFITDSHESALPCLCPEIEVCCITAKDLVLQPEDIREFYGKNGVTISNGQAVESFEMSGGWLLALTLNLEYCGSRGYTGQQIAVDELIEEMFFSHLSKKDQETVLLLGLFDEASEGQICELADLSETTEKLRSLLDKAPLVSYDRVRGKYTLHHVMKKFLGLRLENSPEKVKKRVYTRAGRWYRKNNDRKNAIFCYYRAEEYEEILSLDLTNLIRLKYKQLTFPEMAKKIAEKTIVTVKQNNILKILKLAYIIFSSGDIETYEKILNKLHKYTKNSDDKRLEGEWELINAYRFFPDLGAMRLGLARAEKLLSGKSRVLSSREVCLFGCPSPWYLLYAEPGCAEALIRDVEKVSEIFIRITGGRMTGVPDLLRGEIACMQGDIRSAELYAYKASYAAESADQAAVAYGAGLLLGRIAIARADMYALKETLRSIENISRLFPFLEETSINEYMLHSVRNMIFSILAKTDMLVEDDTSAHIPEDIDAFGVLMTSYVRVTECIKNKEYCQVIGYMEAILNVDRKKCTAAARHYIYIGLSLCYMAVGEMEAASLYLGRAIEVSSPDRIYLTFVRFLQYLQPLMEQPELQKKYAKEIKDILLVKALFPQKAEALFDEKANIVAAERLTRREYEIAKLAAAGMRNKEIAEKLSISERTVKAHMTVVFQKLGVNSRTKLAQVLQ